jgi:hypothetical protein
MSIQYCTDCDKNIDLDKDVEHFDMHKTPIKKVVEIDGQEHETLECPYCGGQVTEYHTPNGEDDYDRHAECKKCGAEWSE